MEALDVLIGPDSAPCKKLSSSQSQFSDGQFSEVRTAYAMPSPVRIL